MAIQDQIRIRKATHEVIELARTKFPTYIPTPEITFSNRMTNTAGMYKYRPRKRNPHEVCFSIPIIENNNVDAFIADTVIHEVSHFVDKVVYGQSGHNNRFYGIMIKLGHKNPTRCHSFKTASNRETFSYQCQGCGAVIDLGAIRHRKVMAGKASYKHKCGGRLKHI